MKRRNTIVAVSLSFLLLPALWVVKPEVASSFYEAGSSLSLADLVPGAQEASIVVRRLWEGEEPDFWSADVSPDGRYVTDTEWVTGDLAVVDLESGSLIRVTNKGSWSESVEWAEATVFSPDGSRIAVNWWNQDAGGYEIRSMGVDGSGIRTILPNPGEQFYSMPDSWSRDGQHILARIWDRDRKDYIALVSVEDGSVQPVVSFESWEEPQLAALSPDGRHVAFDKASSTQSDDYDIFLVSVDGGSPSALVTDPGDDRLMGWAPDGSGILFHSDREFSEGFWWLPMAGSSPVGAPYLVKANVWRPEPIGFAADGRFFYGVTTQQGQVHTAGIDLKGHRLTTPPAAVESPSEGGTRLGEWSPDGRLLAYVNRPGMRLQSVVVRSTMGEGRQVIPFNGRVRQLMWLADGSLVVDGTLRTEDDRRAFYRIDLRTGEHEAIHQLPWEWADAVLSRDGRTVFYQLPPTDGSGHTIMARDLATETDREVTRFDSQRQLGVRPSPNGRLLAVTAWDQESTRSNLLIVSVADGTVQELFDVDAPEGLSLMDWTPDGESVLFTTWDEAGVEGLWLLDKEGGEPILIAGVPTGQELSRFRVHPDGNRVAFNTGQPRGEVWVVEGLPGSSQAVEP